MKKTVLFLICVLLAASAAFAQAGKEAGGKNGAHRFLCSGCGCNSIAIVGKDGNIEWEYPLKTEASDSWLLPGGNIFFSYKGGAREVKPDKSVVWDYVAKEKSEVQGAQPLGGGMYLIGESHQDGTSYLYEMDARKNIKKTVKLTLGGNSHGQFRQVRKTAQGTYLVTQQRGGGNAMEFDADGKQLRVFPDGRFTALRLPNGNTLVACGDAHRLYEMDPANKIVWEVKQNDLPGNELLFVAGVQRLPNGNTVICNWSGHSKIKNQPQIIEITPDKKVVWSVTNPKLGGVSTIGILDDDVVKAKDGMVR